MNGRDFMYPGSALEGENVGYEAPELPEEPILRSSRFGSYRSDGQAKVKSLISQDNSGRIDILSSLRL